MRRKDGEMPTPARRVAAAPPTLSAALAAQPTLKAALRHHAERAWPRECCGLIVRTPGGLAVRPGANLAASTTRFELDAGTILAARRDQTPIVAIYHSHCDAPAVFSAEDQRFAALWPGVEQVLVTVWAGVARDIVVASTQG